MAHVVSQHLEVSPRAYDAEIRRFVPQYEMMLDEAARVLGALRSNHASRSATTDAPIEVLDLGAGTGALSAHLAEKFPRARFTLLDADEAMLTHAKERMRPFGDRARFVRGSFFDPLPRCDVAVASLSLHHVHAIDRKRALYANIRTSIAPGGFLVTADAMVSDVPTLSKQTYARWAAHLVASGDTEAQAYARFDEWSKEDRYFSVAQEIESLRAAGFEGIEVAWRGSPCAVVVALVS
jgi:tRNA (cmo5U34)-methyltransferase